MSPNSASQNAGQVLPRAFGRYTLFDQIGRGGMADIYLARMANSLGGHRLCVIKEIRGNFEHDDAFTKLLTAEAKLAGRLNHANVVQVFDLGRENERLFLAMDYVEGFDLHQLLSRLSRGRIPLPAEFAFSIVIETLRALDYAHRAKDDDGNPLGIVHRDVSPSNVLISFEGEIKLCDFGIARALGEQVDENTIAKTRIAGKAGYMSPEHAQGRELDGRADVYSAGILLWELSAGRRLHKAKGVELLKLALEANVPQLPDRGIPDQPALQAILDRALAKEPDDRYASAAEFLHELEGFAIDQRLRASPLRFGAFLSEHFAADIVGVRRERERAAAALEQKSDPASFGPASSVPDAIADAVADEVAKAPPPAPIPEEFKQAETETSAEPPRAAPPMPDPPSAQGRPEAPSTDRDQPAVRIAPPPPDIFPPHAGPPLESPKALPIPDSDPPPSPIERLAESSSSANIRVLDSMPSQVSGIKRSIRRPGEPEENTKGFYMKLAGACIALAVAAYFVVSAIL